LMEYVLSRGWVEEDEELQGGPGYAPLKEDEEEEDEEAVEAAEAFETAYNFRFETPGGASLQTHARSMDIPGSLRRKEDKRKRMREKRAAKKDEERAKKDEELKRLKNLKRQEIQERLRKIQEMAGMKPDESNSFALKWDEQDFDKKFDPQEWDAKMAEAFNDEYYAQGEDGVLDEESGKPDFGEDIDISDILEAQQGMSEESPVGEDDQKKAKKKKKKSKKNAEDVDEDVFEDFNMDADYVPSSSAAVSAGDENDPDSALGGSLKRIDPEEEKKVLEKSLDELYALDYEDLIGDLPVRFKYRSVDQETFGLGVEEILAAEDKDLNSFVSLKKLAPYRPPEKLVKDKRHWKKNKKKKLQELQEKLVDILPISSTTTTTTTEEKKSKKDKRKRKYTSSGGSSGPSGPTGGLSSDRLASYGVLPVVQDNKFKKKHKS
jgi:protein KRI1